MEYSEVAVVEARVQARGWLEPPTTRFWSVDIIIIKIISIVLSIITTVLAVVAIFEGQETPRVRGPTASKPTELKFQNLRPAVISTYDTLPKDRQWILLSGAKRDSHRP